MGEAERYHEYKKPQARFRIPMGQDGNALVGLFTINVVFFLILLTLQVTYYFYQQTPEIFNSQIVQWFELPASLSRLVERPWTLITYVFSDTGDNIIRIIVNMLWLWAFGSILQQMTGNDKLIPIYIYGGIAGGIFFIASNYMIPDLRPGIERSALLGANAGTMAIAMATTALSPNHKFFTMIRGGISIWVLMLAYLIIDLAGVKGKNAAYSLSHAGGALAGFLFVYFLRRGMDGSVWMNKLYDWVTNLFNPHKKTRNMSTREKVFYKTGNRAPYNKTSIITQQRVDEILDKIHQKGFNHLTEEEKQILKKAAEEDI